MRILFLSPRQSWPTVSGAKLRDYYFAKALGERSQLTYAYFSERGGEAAPPSAFPFCERLEAVPAPEMYTPAKILKGIVSRWPLPVINYTSPAMTEALRAIVRDRPFDAVHLDSMHMAGYVSELKGARTIYNWHNIESELMTRYADGVSSMPRKMYGRFTAHRLSQLEKHLLQTAFGHVVCSEREKEQLLQIAPKARVAVIENGVDTGAFPHWRDLAGEKNRLVFVGSMSYHANIDAATWFTREIWPAVAKRFPALRLSLVGSNPAPAVRALAGDSVDVTGTVPSVEPYYREALAAIVPLRVGGGTRLKILEAMAAGVPVISTTLGAEGLTVAPGENILIADDEAGWSSALESLAASKSRWNTLAMAGRKLVENSYDWRILGRSLFETYRQWLDL